MVYVQTQFTPSDSLRFDGVGRAHIGFISCPVLSDLLMRFLPIHGKWSYLYEQKVFVTASKTTDSFANNEPVLSIEINSFDAMRLVQWIGKKL